jgi:PilZ domain
MPDDRITDAKDLVKQVSDFGERMKERRRYERKRLLWAATVEVRGQRFEGMIVDLSAGGARIRFDAPVATGDELTLVLKQLDELGAKVVWQREGEAGLQFLLAPEEVAARIQQKAALELSEADAGKRAAPPPTPAPAPAPAPRSAAGGVRRQMTLFAALAMAVMGAAIGGSMLVARSFAGDGRPPVLALSGGASDQHSCANLLDKVGGSTNQIDFSLSVASAAQAKCLDAHHLGPAGTDPDKPMVRATKLPLQ